MSNPFLAPQGARWLRGLPRASGLFLLEGIILAVLGMAAITLPFLAGIGATILLGWIFVVAGIIGLISTLGAPRAPGFVWSLLSACLSLAAGAILLWNPLLGLVTLTWLLTAFFALDGCFLVFFSIAHRREQTGRWGWMLANGLADLVLAGLIVAAMPGSFAWALGLLVGIDFLFGGAALIAIGMEMRRSNRHPHAP